MVNKDTSLCEILRNFINTSDFFEGEEQRRYLTFVEDLEKGKIGDTETLESLNQYIEQELRRYEDMAIASHDIDLIRTFTDLRNARVELARRLMQLDPVQEKTEETKKQAEAKSSGKK